MILGMLHHKAVGTFGTVELIKLIELNQFDQPVGIGRIGGIARSLQSTCPAFIIGGLQAEQATVTLTVSEKS